MAQPAPLQFGRRDPGVAYADRPAAFGIAVNDGLLAVVRVTRPEGAVWIDLPGGAIDPGETEEQAMIREFGEETGLVVRPAGPVTRADQYFHKTDGAPVNNRAVVMRAEILGQDQALKIEDDHQLLWLEPEAAMRQLRHDSHAWAVLAWLRSMAA